MSGLALKFTSLLVRTIAKPIGNAIKRQAKDHERFRRLCISFAQKMHSSEIKLRMSLLGENKIKVKPLNDNKAIEQGATFISEFFIFSVAGSLIFYESYRSRKKATNERDALADDITSLQSEIEKINNKLEDINIKLIDYKVSASSSETAPK
ncbi:optic atrophy 3 family protein, putative [Candida dubliniensis CD36]|uniref:Optic atrophy 3 family protein, putative n=1 Tax=Candida dubliniensis (strain CD36 / ATCC MYA-646 / CBS 7987 / NCPF 3949 / NRRL Y-17841) TaxID=573826 RepID=B9WDT4_CANDC|nr:optic atrophy 3 family protein, putative [Candida dubliniensis CD36]CAX42841.1 optic atrophy 3 family protein, putative [Candida dubliniensis CD36]